MDILYVSSTSSVQAIAPRSLKELYGYYSYRLQGVRANLRLVFLREAKRLIGQLSKLESELAKTPKGVIGWLLSSRKKAVLEAAHKSLSDRLSSWVQTTLVRYAP